MRVVAALVDDHVFAFDDIRITGPVGARRRAPVTVAPGADQHQHGADGGQGEEGEEAEYQQYTEHGQAQQRQRQARQRVAGRLQEKQTGGHGGGLASGYNLTFHDEVDVAVIQVPEVAGPEHPAYLCGIDDVAEGAAIGVEKEVNGALRAYIVARADGLYHAYRNVCPHAGRRLDWAPGRFLLKERVMVCAAHGACFRIETGVCISGPCQGEELERIGVRVEGEAVLLDEPGELDA